MITFSLYIRCDQCGYRLAYVGEVECDGYGYGPAVLRPKLPKGWSSSLGKHLCPDCQKKQITEKQDDGQAPNTNPT